MDEWLPDFLPGAAYLAAPGFAPQLAAELGGAPAIGPLYLTPGPPRPVAWAQNTWLSPELIPVTSVKDAARQLRDRQRNWWPCPVRLHRRTRLIADALPHVAARPLRFPAPAPTAPLGSFTLLTPELMLASAACSSPFPDGMATFEEDRTGPPSRAYLKLWEALALHGAMPGPGQTCLDMGACPGGWSWVLARLGASVIAVDKAPLDRSVLALPNVRQIEGSAFALTPAETGPVDWFLSDIICYPERLLGLVERWRPHARRMICTIKFQGDTDFATQARLAALPGARLLHLAHNKHELTLFL